MNSIELLAKQSQRELQWIFAKGAYNSANTSEGKTKALSHLDQLCVELETDISEARKESVRLMRHMLIIYITAGIAFASILIAMLTH